MRPKSEPKHPQRELFQAELEQSRENVYQRLVDAKSFTANPYDGHTLDAQMKQVKSMIGDRVREAHMDMGYRGHDYDGPVTVHIDKRLRGRTSRRLWRWMKRRAAIEPSIGWSAIG
jgi:IS5 family transposase